MIGNEITIQNSSNTIYLRECEIGQTMTKPRNGSQKFELDTSLSQYMTILNNCIRQQPPTHFVLQATDLGAVYRIKSSTMSAWYAG